MRLRAFGSSRRRRSDDLISKLVWAEVDGERLVDEEIVGFVGLLLLVLLAGHVTTTATVRNSAVTFERQRAAVAEIRTDPTLLPRRSRKSSGFARLSRD